jgi:hypothetical protein
MGNDVVAKRLDRFLISEKLLDMGLRFKEKVEEGGSSDHRPISLFWSSKAIHLLHLLKSTRFGWQRRTSGS